MSENTPVDLNRIFQELGEIKGSVNGLSSLVTLSHESTNKRIDDLAANVRDQTHSINTRIDDQKGRIDGHDTTLTDIQKQINADKRKSLLTSGGTSALVAGAIQVLKEIFS